MDLELTDKVAVVTGAGKGIGLAVTKALVDEGARVVAGSRTTDSLDDLDGVTAVALDLSAPDGAAQLIQAAIDEHGRLDVLVNNVGAVRIRSEGFFGTSDEEFEWAMQMNFFIALRATRAALTVMVEQETGAIVNVASVNAFFQPDAGTIDYGITFKGPNKGREPESDLDLGQLIGYSDSDYAASTEDRRCHFGYVFILNGGAVSWASIKQTSNVNATTEAEYIAACEGGKEAVFLHEILYILWPKDHLPITLRGDNEGSIALAKNPEFHKRSKHIDTRYHYIRQLLADNLISIQHVPTKDMVADILTKPLKPSVFGPLLKKMGVGPI